MSKQKGRWLWREVQALSVEVAEKQAKIDALMLEYCPDDMTTEQIANWERHQRASTDPELDAAIDAMKEGK